MERKGRSSFEVTTHIWKVIKFFRKELLNTGAEQPEVMRMTGITHLLASAFWVIFMYQVLCEMLFLY